MLDMDCLSSYYQFIFKASSSNNTCRRIGKVIADSKNTYWIRFVRAYIKEDTTF
jgi:hypothetical protein